MPRSRQVAFVFPGTKVMPTGLMCFLAAFVFHTPWVLQWMSMALVAFHVVLAVMACHKLVTVNEEASLKSVAQWAGTVFLYGMDSWRCLTDEAIPDWVESQKQRQEEEVSAKAKKKD